MAPLPGREGRRKANYSSTEDQGIRLTAKIDIEDSAFAMIRPGLYISSVEELVLIPSESEGISDGVCDVPLCDNPTPLKAFKDLSKIVVNSNDDDTSSDDDDFEDIEHYSSREIILQEKLLNINRLIANIESLNDNSTPNRVLKSPSPFPIPDSDSFLEKSDIFLSYSDNSLPEFESFSDHTEETSSGSTTTHANNSLPEYDSFHFEIEPDQDCKNPVNGYLQSSSDLDEITELQCLYLHKVRECDCLAQNLSEQTEFVSKEIYTKLLRRFAKLEKHSISLEIALQQCQEQLKNDTVCKEKASNVFRKEHEQYFEIQDLKAQLQDKNIAINELKKLVEKWKGKSVDTYEQDTSSRSWNDAHADDANIRPIYDEETMDEVQTTAEINIFATRQQHTKQPKFNNEGKVDQNAKQCHDTCPLPAKLTDNQTTKLSNQSLESENIWKPALQPRRNQSVVRQPTAFKSERPSLSKQRKLHHMIAPGSSRYSSNDMVHNHYLEEAKKKTQESSRNSRPSGFQLERYSLPAQPRFDSESQNGSKCRYLLNHMKDAQKLFDAVQNSEFTSTTHELSSSKLVPKVVPPADKTATSRQVLELLFHHHITMLRSTYIKMEMVSHHSIWSRIHYTSSSQSTNDIPKAQGFKNHESSRIKDKDFRANSDIKDNSSEIKLRGRLLVSFQDDAKYEHVGQDTRSQGGKDDQDKRIKI
ncbi:hypothetical protein Tco_1329110 [Tanacetum coccineum]